jgi:hypothetical protein
MHVTRERRDATLSLVTPLSGHVPRDMTVNAARRDSCGSERGDEKRGTWSAGEGRESWRGKRENDAQGEWWMKGRSERGVEMSACSFSLIIPHSPTHLPVHPLTLFSSLSFLSNGRVPGAPAAQVCVCVCVCVCGCIRVCMIRRSSIIRVGYPGHSSESAIRVTLPSPSIPSLEHVQRV